MKSQIIALALFGCMAAVAYGTDAKSWNDWFDHETDTCRPLCEEPGKGGDSGENTKPPAPTESATTAAEGFTTLAGFTTVPAGYTPTTGECVCVSPVTEPTESWTGVEGSTGFGVSGKSSPAYLVSSTPSDIGGSGSGSGEGGGSTCILIEVFWNFTLIFEGEIKQVWIEFVEHCDKTIFSIEWYTAEEKFIKVVYALKALFAEYEEIKIALQYEWIVEWGYVIDLFTVVVNVQYEYINSTIIIDEQGSCPLFDALLNATEGNSEQHDACLTLIDELTIIIESSYYSYFDKLYEIYVKFEAFFEEHASWKSFFLEIEIEGFGTLEQFISITYVFEQISTVEVVIGGSTSECVLLEVLMECYENTSLSTSVRSEIKEFYEKLSVYFETEIDVYIRLEYFMEQSFQFYLLEDWIIEYIYGLELGSWGTLYELIACGYFHDHCGWGSHITTVGPSSTVAQTTVEASTAEVPTTTPTQGDCGSRDTLIEIDESKNTTILTTSINSAYATWTTSYQNQFKGYKKRVEVLIWGSLEVDVKIYNISMVLGNYATDDRETTLKAVQIGKWGTVGQFCGCSGF